MKNDRYASYGKGQNISVLGIISFLAFLCIVTYLAVDNYTDALHPANMGSSSILR